MSGEGAERDPDRRDQPLPAGASELRTRIAGSVGAPATARHLLRDLVAPHADAAEHLDALMLLTSEVVTNAVSHPLVTPGSAIEMCVTVGPELTRVVVSDLGTGFERRTADPPRRSGGFGLLLLDKAASRWGTLEGPGRFSVWFELDHAQQRWAARP